MSILLLLLACWRQPEPDPGLSVEQITKLVRPGTKEAAGWAQDVRDAIVAAGKIPDADHVCQVLAIIEQESGYEADPAVPDLAKVVEGEIDGMLSGLGPLAGLTKEQLLDHTPQGQTKSFRERLAEVKTERDVDLLFRDIVAFHQGRIPAVGAVTGALFPRFAEKKNPIATAGSMQVQVAWAQERGREEGLDDLAVRDALYTRAGGVKYGTARLFAVEASYDDPIYRFADFNAGVYASRNAAFQTLLADLTALELAPDGDVLLYNENGSPRSEDGETMRALLSWRAGRAPDLGESRIRSDAKREKELEFERTTTWQRVREDWAAKTGEEPPYARVPDVSLDSPKLANDLSTRWFAEKVKGRYTKCLSRGK